MDPSPFLPVLDSFEALVRARRSTRHFTAQSVDPALLERLLEITHWAPTGYNLQPIHYTLVTSAELRAELIPACFDQSQMKSAPAVVIFSGDRRVVEHHQEEVLRRDLAAGAIDSKYEKLLRGFIRISFGQGPFGLNWLWKALLSPVIRLIRPLYDLPAVHKKLWLTRQAGLPAMTFMLAAQAAGLATVPMEGFCPKRVARIVNLPSHHVPILVIPVGYSATPNQVKTRLPLERVLHRDRW